MKRANWWIVAIAIVVSALTSIVSGFASSALHSRNKETVVPNTFTAGTTASAAEVNENFQALATSIDGVAANAVKAWAWVRDTGVIVLQGGTSTVTITKVGTGQYCIQTDPDVLFNYGPILATLQGPDGTTGFISANDGWGSACNPYGGVGVFTSNSAGVAADKNFVVVIP